MSKDDNEAVRGFMPSALLFAAVALVMVAGMVLKTGPKEAETPVAVPASPAPPLPLGTAITPDLTPAAPAPPASEPVPADTPQAAHGIQTNAEIKTGPKLPPGASPLIVKLAARAEGDSGRLAKARGRWTAQLLVACQPETVERLLSRAKGSSGVYILPVQVKDNACFRVCYGTYASLKDAAEAADLPKSLRGKERIGAIEIAKVIP